MHISSTFSTFWQRHDTSFNRVLPPLQISTEFSLSECIEIKGDNIDIYLVAMITHTVVDKFYDEIFGGAVRFTVSLGRSGLAVACLTAVREVPGSNRAVGNCVYRTTTAIYSLGHVLCAPFLQCLGQLSLLPSVGR